MTQDENIKRFTAQIEKLKGHWQSLDIRVVCIRVPDKWMSLGARIVLDTKKSDPQARPKSLLTTEHLKMVHTTRQVDELPKVISQLEKGVLEVGDDEILCGVFKDGKLERPNFMVYRSYRRSERGGSPYMGFTCFYLQGIGESHGNIYRNADAERDELDWELRTSPFPFDGLNEVGQRFLQLDEAFADNRIVVQEVIAPVYVGFTEPSQLTDGKLTLTVKAHCKVPNDELAVGTAMFLSGDDAIRSRGTLEGAESSQQNGNHFLRLEIETEAHAVQAFLAFRGVGIDALILYDESILLENPRILAHDHFDPRLAKLRQYLFGGEAKGIQLEFAASWLLHMCGFSVQLYGPSHMIRNEIDIVAFVPDTDYVLAVECTGELPDVGGKLSKLSSRSRQLQGKLQYDKILPVLVTAMRKSDVPVTEREKAGKEGIALVGADELGDLLNAAQKQTPPGKILEQLGRWIPRGDLGGLGLA